MRSKRVRWRQSQQLRCTQKAGSQGPLPLPRETTARGAACLSACLICKDLICDDLEHNIVFERCSFYNKEITIFELVFRPGLCCWLGCKCAFSLCGHISGIILPSPLKLYTEFEVPGSWLRSPVEFNYITQHGRVLQ